MKEEDRRGKGRRPHIWIVRTVKLVDLILMTGAAVLFCEIFYLQNRVADIVVPEIGECLLLFALYAIVFLSYGRIYDAFALTYSRISEIVYSQTLAAFISDFILYIVIWLTQRRVPNVLPVLGLFLAQVVIASIWSYAAHHWYFDRYSALKTVIVYEEEEKVTDMLTDSGMDVKFNVVQAIPVEECIGDPACLKGAEVVFLMRVNSNDRNEILKYCMLHGINIVVSPEIGDVMMSGASYMNVFRKPVYFMTRQTPKPEYAILKRVFDIVSSALMLVITSPIFLVTAIAIKICDRGPVFYKQTRLTKGGKTFEIVKFRSMVVDAEKESGARLSTGDADDRVTPVGRVIRKVRIDELPQLINIIKGDMSVVGPRPERPEIAAEYEKELPEFKLRLQVKAGLTGLAQVRGKYNTTPYDKLIYDLVYISHPSFLNDLRIIFQTIKILFLPESTEGVEAEDDERPRRVIAANEAGEEQA